MVLKPVFHMNLALYAVAGNRGWSRVERMLLPESYNG